MSNVMLAHGYQAIDTGKRLKNGSGLRRFDLVDREGRLVWSFGGILIEEVLDRMEEEIVLIETEGRTTFDLRAGGGG